MKKFNEWLESNFASEQVPDWFFKELKGLSPEEREKWDRLMGPTDQDKIHYFLFWLRWKMQQGKQFNLGSNQTWRGEEDRQSFLHNVEVSSRRNFHM